MFTDIEEFKKLKLKMQNEFLCSLVFMRDHYTLKKECPTKKSVVLYHIYLKFPGQIKANTETRLKFRSCKVKFTTQVNMKEQPCTLSSQHH